MVSSLGALALTATLVSCSNDVAGSSAPRPAGFQLATGANTGLPEPDPSASIEPTVPTTDPTITALPATEVTAAPVTAAPATEPPATVLVTEPAVTEPLATAPVVETVPTTLPEPVRIPVAPLAEPLQAVGTSNGEQTGRIQQRLVDLGFWLAAVDGQYGLTTTQAVMAFQKYSGLDASGRVDQQTADTLTSATVRAHGLADTGTLVEVDKARQLLFFVQNGVTTHVFNASTGNGEAYEEPDQNVPGKIQRGVSITPSGLWAVDRERPEGWWEGDLGRIYRPKYFRGGVAVHGSNNVPNYPASHGCVRVTTAAMDFIWDSGLMPMRIPVWVHGPD